MGTPQGSAPRASRPYMPGYGLLGPTEGSGLLSWSWAEQQLTTSRNYWVTTVRPDSTPHVVPVWGLWSEQALWFSSSLGSRKIRNLRANPRCAMATEEATEPVVVEGIAEIITDSAAIGAFLAGTNAKYDTDIDIGFLDPAVNATVRLRPVRAFALREEDFHGSPTRWTFPS